MHRLISKAWRAHVKLLLGNPLEIVRQMQDLPYSLQDLAFDLQVLRCHRLVLK